MTLIRTTIRLLTGWATGLALACVAHAAPVDTGHLVAELVASDNGVAPGQTIQVALRQDIDAGWHTYWRNPGDSGEATQVKWTLPAGWSAGEIQWPAPRRLPIGPLVNYGYEGRVLLPMALTAPANARPGETVRLNLAASFLVCKEICVPEDAELSLSLPVVPAPAPDTRWASRIAAAVAAAPREAGLVARYRVRAGGVELGIAGPALVGEDAADAYFFPYDGGAIQHARPQTIERGPRGLTLTLAPGPSLSPAASQRLAGVLAIGGKAYEVDAAPGSLPEGAAGLGPPSPKTASPSLGGLAAAMGLAFLGGLVLNLMPCVFPILAMKAAAFVGHGRERSAARAHGLAFGAGVLSSFLALAGLLIGLRTGGAAIGWGFQLQSPPVIAVLALLMLAVALNLSGVFQAGTSLQGAGAGLASRRGLAGAALTGALAVVVAAPCTAPFMAPAIGWALTMPPVSALCVFLALGAGFAAPFVLLATIPGAMAWLPRPGAWMLRLKQVLAFPMYGAAGWLAWVLTVQAGSEGLARLLAAGVTLALAAWLAGVAQASAAQGRRARGAAGAAVLAAVLALVAVLVPPYPPAPAAASRAGDIVPAEPYSPDRLAALRAQGRPVFVNYTAAWCVSCQVNDRVAISTPRSARAFAAYDVAYLKADWTRRDPLIAADLAAHGRAGVPLYLVYGVDGGPPAILPALLTEGLVEKALADASRRG